MSDKIWFDPTSDKWVLSDGEHHLEVPHWAREIIVNEFERETRQLKAENAKLRESVKRLMAQRDERLARAEADNAKLREQSERLFDKTLELATENSKLRELCKLCEREVENAKLRELVLCLLTCASDCVDCNKCPVNGGLGIWDFEDFCDGLLDRVHELRIEVGE